MLSLSVAKCNRFAHFTVCGRGKDYFAAAFAAFDPLRKPTFDARGAIRMNDLRGGGFVELLGRRAELGLSFRIRCRR